MKQWIALFTVGLMLLGYTTAYGEIDNETKSQIEALQKRVAELEAQQTDQAVKTRNAELIKDMLREMNNGSAGYAADTGVTAGYDKRFFIKSADDQFMLSFDTRLQVRHTYQKYDDCGGSDLSTRTSVSNAELERAKLILSGHVLKDLKYRIQLEADDDSRDDAWLQEYEVSYSFMPEFGLKAGRYKGAFSRQEITSSGRQMMVDRSLANEVFTISRTSGAEVFGELPVGDEMDLHYRAGVSNGFRDERRLPLVEYDNNPAVTARVVLPMLGSSPSDFLNESDLEGHDNPVMQAGVSFAYNNARNEYSPAGGDEGVFRVIVPSSDGDMYTVNAYGEISMLAADIMIKCQGLSLIGDLYYQHANLDSAELPSSLGTGPFGPITVDGDDFDNFGWTAQAGYFIIPQTFELVSRIGGLCIDSAGSIGEYAGGWNYYISGQDLKLSMDVTYIDDIPNGFADLSSNIFGIGDESLLMIRTQLQFQF